LGNRRPNVIKIGQDDIKYWKQIPGSALVYLSGANYIDLARCERLGDDDMRYLANVPQLDLNFGHIGANGLSYLTGLKRMVFNFVSISASEINLLPNLEELELCGCWINIDCELFGPNLRRLAIIGGEIYASGPYTFPIGLEVTLEGPNEIDDYTVRALCCVNRLILDDIDPELASDILDLINRGHGATQVVIKKVIDSD
jgi:hypothetical protein